jgi:hypothetical protein
MTNLRNRTPRPRLVGHPTIMAGAATPAGFGATEGRHISVNLHRVCRRMADAGLLFAGKASGRVVRYFLNQADADAFVVKYKAQMVANLQARRAAREKSRVRAKRIKAKKPPKVKVEKPPKAVRVAAPKVAKVAKVPKQLRDIPQHQKIVIRKPYSPPPPKQDAVIVWPAHIKPVCRLMGLGRYEAVVPLRRIGDAGWSMSVGGAQ